MQSLQKEKSGEEKAIQFESKIDLGAMISLPNECIAEILSYLSHDHPLLNVPEGLSFFGHRDLVFKIKLRDNFRVDWKQCIETFGKDNLCLPNQACEHLVHCYGTPGWGTVDDSSLVSISHPYLPACVLKQISEEQEFINPLLIAWQTGARSNQLSEDHYRTAMRLSCLSGNVELVQSLGKYGCRPQADHLHHAIIIRCLPLVQYLLSCDGIAGCSTCFSYAVEFPQLDILQHLLEEYPLEYQASMAEDTLKRACTQQAKFLKNADDLEEKDSSEELQKIIDYLSHRKSPRVQM